MTTSLGRQFGDEPKKRWVPNQKGHSISWHILNWHTKGTGPSNAKSVGNGSSSMRDYDMWHKRHMQMHEDGTFEVGQEHEHFTPKDR